MMTGAITGLLILIPLLAGLLLLVTKAEQAKKVAFAASLLELVVTSIALFKFNGTGEREFVINYPWVKSLGINFYVGMDGISLLLVLLTTGLVPLIIFSSFNKSIENPSLFYALILFMQMALVGVFVAMDGFLFYIFWELALIPIWFICLLWGSGDKARITFKFFVYTLTGSLFMLAALIYLYIHTEGIHSFSIDALYQAGRSLGPTEQAWIFWGMFIAFAIKMPVFPFHTWQPDTYVSAPTQGTMLLSGIMLKMGIYGLIRWLIPLAPMGVEAWGSTAIILSVIGIIYASCLAIYQKDMKRLVAYSSIAHVGLIAAGIMAVNAQGLQGGIMQMISHGINVVGLFFIIDIIESKTNTRQIDQLGGIRNVNPNFSVLFLIVLLGSVALPLTNGFVGEFLLISGVYQFGAWTAAIAGLTVILGAVYMLRTYQSVMLGNINSLTEKFDSLHNVDKTILVIICALILIIGVYPKPLLDIAGPAVKMYVQNYGISY
jgi:NADH-quinone oxidoreductase subunit M